MKQNITTEQLSELSEKGMGKLRVWWKPKYGDWYAERWGKKIRKNKRLYVENLDYDIIDPIPESNWIPPKALPLLSIGQMIEFLNQEELDSILLENVYSGGEYRELIKKEDFCSALWKASKEVLEL